MFFRFLNFAFTGHDQSGSRFHEYLGFCVDTTEPARKEKEKKEDESKNGGTKQQLKEEERRRREESKNERKERGKNLSASFLLLLPLRLQASSCILLHVQSISFNFAPSESFEIFPPPKPEELPLPP